MQINNKTNDMYEDRKCSDGCGRKAEAMWRFRAVEIFLCRWCAMSVLPKFLADACEPKQAHEITSFFDKFKSEFFRALCLVKMRG